MIAEEIQVKNRFSGAIWSEKIAEYPALIVGLGATGGYLSFFLARAGVNSFLLVDPDYFEIHNLGSQLAGYNHIGKSKSTTSQEMLLNYTNASITNTSNQKIENVSTTVFQRNKIICASLDTMSGRKYMFNKFLELSPEDSIFFDSRIGAEYWEVYCVPKNNLEKIEKYKETLFGDDKGNKGACNYQQSSHSACGAALKIVELTTNWVTNIITEDDILPFKITNDIRTNNYGVYY